MLKAEPLYFLSPFENFIPNKFSDESNPMLTYVTIEALCVRQSFYVQLHLT